MEASVEGRDLGGAAAEVREHLERELKLIAICVAVFAVFILLYLALGSTAEALVILATLPDAFVGGILALLIAGESWNVRHWSASSASSESRCRTDSWSSRRSKG